MKPLILVGAGGHAMAVADVALASGWKIAGVLSPLAPPATVLALPWLGGDDWLDRPEAHDFAFIVGLGMLRASDERSMLFNKLQHRELVAATIVAPTAWVSPYAKLGVGTVVMHSATIGPRAEVGANVIVNTAANVEHDTVVGDHVHVSTGAIINGACRIGTGAMIGSAAVVMQRVAIGERVTLGASALARHDIAAGETHAGVPSRRLA